MEKTESSRTQIALRCLLGGLIWAEALFIAECIDSAMLIKRSTDHIRTDEATRTLLLGGVLDYVFRVQGVYLLIGLMAAGLLLFTTQLWFPVQPSRRGWWRVTVSFAGIVTLFGHLRQARTLPTMADWLMFLEPFWIDTAELWMLDGAAVVLMLWGLLKAARRWAPHGGLRAMLPRVIPLVAWVLGLAVLLQHPHYDGPQQANDGPNVLLLGIDALRPDHLGSEGYFRDTAPNIDAFLSESVVFEQAYTPMARTYPSWTSMMSAAWPTTHGVRDNLPTPENLVPDMPLLPQLMVDAGFETGFITDDSRFSYMVPGIGFNQIVQPELGIQNFAVSVNEPRFRTFHEFMHNPIGFALVPVMAYNQAFGKSYRPWMFEERVAASLRDLADSDRFLAAIHSCVLHAPGDRIDPFFRMYDQKGYNGKNRLRYSQSGSSQVYVEDTGEYNNLTAAQDVRIYDSGIAMADSLVGRVLDDLKQSGLDKNTIIVLFSDHGENMWAPDLPYTYRGPNHGFHTYDDGQNRVTLAIRFLDGQYAGQRVSSTVRLIDLAPTLAEILGIEWPGEIDGLSMMPLVRGETEEEDRLVYIETGLTEKNYWPSEHRTYPFRKVSERYEIDPVTGLVSIRPEFRPHLIAAKDRAVQRGKWKLVWRPTTGLPIVELFDREADPHNTNDIYTENLQVAASLGLELEPFVVGDGDDATMFETWRRIQRAVLLREGIMPDEAPEAPEVP